MNVPPKSNDPCWCGSGRKYKRCHKADDGGSPRRVSVADGAARLLERSAASGRVQPGVLSSPRPVPPHIIRPDYAATGTPGRATDRLVKTPEEIERLRRSCRAAAEVLEETGRAVAPGVTTDAIDAICHDAYIARGGYPSTLNYHGYPKSLCTSVNEVICHGIPDSRELVDGDIVNLDVTIFLDGMHGDTNATFLVGEVDEASRRLVDVTRECLDRAIAVVGPDVPLNEIGRAIQNHAEANGFGVVRAFVGHGIGETFHMTPQVPHYYDPAATTRVQTGWVFTIEPMITLGTWRHRLWDDNWTAVTADYSRTAQFEHTILVTDDGAEVLTVTDAKVGSPA
ncbi:MAG: type I methionyl aminopeptidase [Acidimicrobiales bacterium]